MAEINNFDDAKEKVLQELNGAGAEGEAPAGGEPQSVPEDTPVLGGVPTDTPTAAAEPTPAQPSAGDVAKAADPYDILSQQANALGDATSRIQAYRSEIESLKRQLAEQNSARREEVMENAMKEELTPPVPPDFSHSDFLSDEERNRMWSDFIGKSTEYAIAAARKEYQPYIEAAEEGQRSAKEQAVIAQMSRPESGLPGFADELPTIKRVIAENPLFKNSDDIEANFLNAYLLTKGGRNFEPKTSLSDDDLKLLTQQQMMNLYDSNPDFQRAVAKKLQDNLKDGQNIPQFSASGNTSNSAAANTEPPVLTFKEAAERMKKYL